MDVLEQIFAAAVFNDRHDPDAIECAWIDFVECSRALGRSEAEIREAANCYITWDFNAEPEPQPVARPFARNVVPLR